MLAPEKDKDYNSKNYPIFVCHDGNWDIYRNEKGYCVALPVNPECRASHFGDARYTALTLGVDVFNPKA